MTKDQIQERLKSLNAQRENLFAQINAFNGAIEDCNYWIGVVTQEADPTTSASVATPNVPAEGVAAPADSTFQAAVSEVSAENAPTADATEIPAQ